ncbi:MAG TPA: PSD1 and planctomycete cytochrome C domain-containing protein [Pirellulales bacterium]|nr:PSD1 and planctomycete cytochrome C domain-containing protein [Pirellulales bacterium]
MMPRVSLLVLLLSFAGPASSGEKADYLRDVKPVLARRCYACHAALKQRSGLRLDTAAAIRRGGDGGPAVEPGKSAESLLIAAVTGAEGVTRMPPEEEGEPLKPEEIAALKSWIDQGAEGPADEAPQADPKTHWAFQRIKRPVVPIAAGAAAVRNPIDAFVARAHDQHEVVAAAAAAKSALLRRVYFDLIGLPPTREELHAHLADGSADAYEQVVDRLLRSPRYGERWGRHWMDIWRYSDWYGRRYVPDVWNSAPQIWRWRDWIVRSLNADHGYDRMLREMLAADEICPDDDEAAVATGYLVRNWYALNPNDWMRSTVEHTGKAFLGLTFNCAHCHDHKYDPITQDDYFRLRASFEPISIRQDRVAGEADPGPFQEYSYSVLRKIQRLGAVRIFDKNPEAPTWFYTGGDERNRVTERGSIAPGVPAFLTASSPKIEPVRLPARASYPGLRPAIQHTVLAEARAAVAVAETEFTAAKNAESGVPPDLRERLAQAEAAVATATREAELAGKPGALSGRQSLLLDATEGRRLVQNSLTQLKMLEDGATFEFRLLILSDAHVNFQFAKDVVKGLTAGVVAFEKGRIVSYQPGSTTEFHAGQYDFAAGQVRFKVKLVLQTKADRCLLTVRSLTDDRLLVDGVAVALNGWNPVGDATKAITFDARPGSVAVIDDVILTAPMAADANGGSPPARLAAFDFEAPAYTAGQDVTGVEGWTVSAFSAAPATSVVSASAANASLWELSQKLHAARRAARILKLPLLAAEVRAVWTRIELAGVEARIAADRAKYGETPGADIAALVRAASRLEREAALKKAEAEVLTQEHGLAGALAKPATDANRGKEVEDANGRLAVARAAHEAARAALADESLAEKFTAFSPVYPRTSTGRRRALAEWITSHDNPLTARVAVNHIWGRHFHAPLVASVYDFGRAGSPPTNPELLDWLAAELMESGWSMKHLHRLIVTSAAYRRASWMENASRNDTRDPENKLLWRMNTGRMESEVVRDSLLFCAERLDLRMGGQELENSDALTTFRRSVYYSVYPEQGGKSALGELFDAPDALDCYRRTSSIVPQQALALTNSDLVHKMSAAIVSDWETAPKVEPPGGEQASVEEYQLRQFITVVFERILAREPTDRERRLCEETYRKQCELLARDNAADAATRARESIVRALLNHNDFITIR